MSYTKTNWENLPSTTTPVNATNLNKIENQLVNMNPDFIFGVLTSDFTIPTTDTYATIPFLNGYQLGSNLSISNGVITVGNNVSVLKIACTLAVGAGAVARTRYLRVTKNTNTVVVIERVDIPASASEQMVLTPFIVPVQNGDTIKFEIYGANTDTLIGGSRTNCIVEKITA